MVENDENFLSKKDIHKIGRHLKRIYIYEAKIMMVHFFRDVYCFVLNKIKSILILLNNWGRKSKEGRKGVGKKYQI